MPRTTKGPASRKRRKRLLKKAKGYRRGRNKRIKVAKETVMRALSYAKRDRRVRKRDMRSLWIQRINAAGRLYGISYNRLIQGLKKADVQIDRKMLAQLAVEDLESFAAIVEVAKEDSAATNREAA